MSENVNKHPHIITTRLCSDMLDKLDTYCEDEDRTRAGAIRRFIRLALEEENKE